MFGIKKKKPMKKPKKKVSTNVKKKTVKKVSTNVKKKASKKVSKKIKTSEVSNESIVNNIEGELKDKLEPKKKSFDSTGDMAAYYARERSRMKKTMQDYNVSQAKGSMEIAKSDLMKLLLQKRKMGQIGKDLEEHKNLLNKKIDEFSLKKVKTQANKERIQNLVDKMKFLEDETKKIIDTKDHLNHREAKLIEEMKKTAGLTKKDLRLSDIKDSSELDKFEISKEGILFRAQELLSEESETLFADNSLLDKLKDDAIKKLSELNAQLASLHGAKKETLRKRHLLEISKKDTEKALVETKVKVNRLEEKYKKLLKQ